MKASGDEYLDCQGIIIISHINNFEESKSILWIKKIKLIINIVSGSISHSLKQLKTSTKQTKLKHIQSSLLPFPPN